MDGCRRFLLLRPVETVAQTNDSSCPEQSHIPLVKARRNSDERVFSESDLRTSRDAGRYFRGFRTYS
jgi:hypothetical protein